jgi:hypothetical protein
MTMGDLTPSSQVSQAGKAGKGSPDSGHMTTARRRSGEDSSQLLDEKCTFTLSRLMHASWNTR